MNLSEINIFNYSSLQNTQAALANLNNALGFPIQTPRQDALLFAAAAITIGAVALSMLSSSQSELNADQKSALTVRSTPNQSWNVITIQSFGGRPLQIETSGNVHITISRHAIFLFGSTYSIEINFNPNRHLSILSW